MDYGHESLAWDTRAGLHSPSVNARCTAPSIRNLASLRLRNRCVRSLLRKKHAYMNHLRRTGKAALTASVVLSVALLSCSALIDVPADCVDVDCAPYICDDDGIACATGCSASAQCSEGYTCDAQNQTCEYSGCVPDGPAIRLDMPELVVELHAAYAMPEGVAHQLIVFASNRLGFGFRRFQRDGTFVAADPLRPGLELVSVVDSNPDRARFFPFVEFVPSSEVRFTGDVLDASTPRLIYAFSDISRETHRLTVGTFVLDPVSPPVNRVVYEPVRFTQLASTSLVRRGGDMVVAWRERPRSVGVAFAAMALTNLRGEVTEGYEPVRVSPAGEGVDRVGSGLLGDRFVIIHDAVMGPTRRVLARVVSDEGEPIATFVLTDELDASRDTLGFIHTTAFVDRMAIYYSVSSTQGVRVFRASLSESMLSGVDPEISESVDVVDVTADFSGLRTSSVTNGPREVIAAWIGSRQGSVEQGLWYVRYGPDGAPLFAPGLLNEENSDKIEQHRWVLTSEGYNLIYAVDTGAGREVYMRRLICDGR